MSTSDFLSAIWPTRGVFFIVTPFIDHEGSARGFSHFGHDTIDSAVWQMNKLVKEGRTVYHACASYTEKGGIVDAKGKKRKRVVENIEAIKAFWIDLDVGEDKPYGSQEVAIADVTRFCTQISLPLPMFVSSGNGIHAYWPLTTELDYRQWSAIAVRFRAVLDFCDVKHDSSRTTDGASILRPVGAINTKRKPHKPVELLTTCEPISPIQFVQIMQTVIAENNLPVTELRKKFEKNSLNSDLLDDQQWPDVDLNKVADKCAQVRLVRDTKGLVDEPLWYATLGIIKFGLNSEDTAIEWSSGHEQFDEASTLNKMDQWHYPPTTCSKLCAINPAGCEGCKYQAVESIKSPVQLGWVEPEEVTEEIAKVDEDTGTVVYAKLQELPENVSAKYRWTKTGMMAKVWKKDIKEFVWEHAFDAFIYPEAWNRDKDLDEETGEAIDSSNIMQIRMRRRPGVWETFFTPTALLGSKSKFSEHMSAKAMYGEFEHMHGYLKEWMRHLSNEVDHAHNYNRFGWHGNDFLCGEFLYRQDGSINEVRVTGEALNKAHFLRPNGDLQEWIEVIDSAYNHKDQEQYQFLLCAGFGAPLFSLLGGANCPASMMSSVTYGSGQGKSTAQRFALSIYGDPSALELSAKNTTEVALYIYLGLYSNLPVMVDEITNMDGMKISDIAYTISQGRPKERGTQSGGLRHNNFRWNTLVLTSGNRSLVSTVGTAKANAEAEICRMFECSFDRNPPHTKAQFDAIERKARGNYGTAGQVFLQYVASHREEVTDLLFAMQAKLDAMVDMQRRERFWSVTAASVLTGAIIAKKLGLIKFDVANLVQWTAKQIHIMRAALKANTSDDGDVFAEMLAELFNGVLVTDRDGVGRRPVRIDKEPRGNKVVGRVVLEEKVLYLAQSAVREWCSRRQVDHNKVYQWAKVHGYVIAENTSFPLGRGTPHTIPPTMSWVLSIDKMDGVTSGGKEPIHLLRVAS